MLKFRTGIILAALFLAGCDHHKTSQSQDEAGQASVAQNDSELTGQPATPAPAIDAATQKPYPRAALVALPAARTSQDDAPAVQPAIAAPPVMADSTPSTSSSPSTPPPTDSAPAVTPTPAASADSDAPRLAMDTHVPTVSTTPTPTATDNSTSQQVVVLQTTLGTIVIQLDDFAAPQTCANFRKLVSDGFYNHTTFHRVIPHFMVQGGDPNSKSDDRISYGLGGPGYTVPAEIKLKHDEGAVAMARSPDSINPQRDSNGSQFYICVAPCPSLDNQYTVFGHVIKGMDTAILISNQPKDNRDNPNARIEMQASLENKDKALADGSGVNP